ncbi:hypothetical protein [Arthrobacter ramosus]|uniref:O-antigen ligase n=1 Tax=Arthrobacter ramosus TaxID=1672 RepID=A0ABV5XUW5_ARTRM|nr:hypothetical protein [Arthrobacter ramosus]
MAAFVTAWSEGLVPHRRPWFVVLALATESLLPFVSPDVSYPGQNAQWVLAHVALIAMIFCAQFFSPQFIGGILRAGLMGSLLTLLGGANALSVDERSLFLLDGRLRGVYGHPNITGMVAVIALLLAIGNSRWKKVDVVLSVAVIASAVSLTSLVAAALGLAAWSLRSLLARRIAWVVGLASLFVPALAVVMLGPRLDPALLTGRAAAWEWVLGLQIPVVSGLGIGLFDSLGAGKFVQWFHAHNQFIMDFSTGGLPLAGLTLGILAVLGFWAASTRDRRPFVMWFVLILQCFTEVPLWLGYPNGTLLSTSIIILLILGLEVNLSKSQTGLRTQSLSTTGRR